MKLKNKVICVTSFLLFSHISSAALIEKFELENGVLLPGYTGVTNAPFNGVVAYGNGDGVTANAQLSGIPGRFRLDIRGASSANNAASISVSLGGQLIGSASFNGTTASVQSINFDLPTAPANSTLKFELTTDNGSNDTFLDWYELHNIGDIPPPPPPPVLPSQGAYESGVYRNMFEEAGYSKAEVNAKVNAAYDQLFHSPNAGVDGERFFIPVGNDMAYIWDVHNNDVRSEGMSYGMMMAVQLGRKDDFDRLWKWATTYSLNKDGDMKGYFGWRYQTNGQPIDKNPAPDGEEYFVTALFFASNLWGDGQGIYNYRVQANKLLDDMFNNGQTRYNNQGQLENFSLFNHTEKQIVFSPATPSDRNWTDPSYHLPAFYELWARWADNNNQFWADLAVVSRGFLKKTVVESNGLSPDYAYFDGRPHGEFQAWKDTFQYDAWRTAGNAAMDFYWWQKDTWQETYAKNLQTFFKSEGINSYASLYELDGTRYENNQDHSPGLVAMNALASLASNDSNAWDFVNAFWNTEAPKGRFRYYDGALYMFGLLGLSGNYNIICPAGECANITPPPSCEDTNSCSQNIAPVANRDTATVQSGGNVIVNVLQNDTDANNDVLSLVDFTQAGNGSVSQNGNTLSYTANDNFTGTDTFMYTVSDGELSSNGTVNVEVTAAPTDPTIPPTGGLLEHVEVETGTISPSYRQPINNPYSGVILYSNNESVTLASNKLSAGSYELKILGSSNNNNTADLSVYVGGSKVGEISFTSPTRVEKTLNFTLSSAASDIKFSVEKDVGRSDTLIDWYELYGAEDGGNAPDPIPPTSRSTVTIQAEDYTTFFDNTDGNQGGAYKSDDVDIEAASDTGGGFNIGWIAAEEWLEYNANFEGGNYVLHTRVASTNNSGSFAVQLDANNLVSQQNVSATGGWQNWTTLQSSTVNIPAGQHTIRLNMIGNNFNVNWLEFRPVN